jgi:hypothetical protein
LGPAITPCGRRSLPPRPQPDDQRRAPDARRGSAAARLLAARVVAVGLLRRERDLLPPGRGKGAAATVRCGLRPLCGEPPTLAAAPQAAAASIVFVTLRFVRLDVRPCTAGSA